MSDSRENGIKSDRDDQRPALFKVSGVFIVIFD